MRLRCCAKVVDSGVNENKNTREVINMRLIDADALNDKLCETTIFIKDGVAFQRMINDAPTIDAVQVVRCKDCIHAQNMNKLWSDGRQIVFCWKHGIERLTTSDWYCRDGEREEESQSGD